MATIIKSATLIAGEKFTLPPNSVLIGSTDIGDLSSNCDIPDLEEIACYVFIFAAAAYDGTPSQYFEGGDAQDVHITGYRFNGIDTIFTTDYKANAIGIFDIDAIATELKGDVGGVIKTVSGVYVNSGRGALNYLLVQTIPSIADNLELIFAGTIPDDNYNTAISRVPLITLESATSLNYANLPACPTGTAN